jgi:hypothetical protein
MPLTVVPALVRIRRVKVRHVAVTFWLVGAVVATTVLTAVSAEAQVPAFGDQLGNLMLSPAAGPVSSTPTWSTTACPLGFQGSAVLEELNTDGSIAAAISPTGS